MKNILIVEDDIQTARLLQLLMEREGFCVSTRYHGVDAIRFLEANMPDLILMDIQLPGYDGFEILHWLRVKKKRQMVPVILLTAYRSTYKRLLATELGATDLIFMPFKVHDLVARVHEAMNTAVFPLPTTPSWPFMALNR